MRGIAAGLVAAIAATSAAATAPRPASSPAAVYYPGPRDDWQRRSPEQVGLNAARMAEAVFAVASETRAPRDLALHHALAEGREPFDAPVGPYKERGPATGLIVRNGYIVAEWGEPRRVDMTFSVTKSFLSTVVGLAFDPG
jgi:hypothetical protein